MAFVDSACAAKPTWLEIRVKDLLSSNADGIGAPIRNVAFRRSVLLAVGSLEDRPGIRVEDVDLSFRLIDTGYTLTTINSGSVRHYGAPRPVCILARKLFRYGQGNYVLSSR